VKAAYRPMLATLVDKPFDDKMWVFETKWDGFRLVTKKHGDTVTLWSRNGIDVTTKYAVLLSALQKIEGSCVIDGGWVLSPIPSPSWICSKPSGTGPLFTQPPPEAERTSRHSSALGPA
jgi:hypothetical protein